MTFTIDGTDVPGCTRIPVGPTGIVNCTLPSGYSSAGARMIGVNYSGGHDQEAASSTRVERVLPEWHGLWFATGSGRIETLGGAAPPRSGHARVVAEGAIPSGEIVAVAPTPDELGYWVLGRNGAVRSYGDARQLATRAPEGGPFVSLSPTFDGRGYWLLSSKGRVLSYGDARRYGEPEAAAVEAAGGVVDLAATPDGRGYFVLSKAGRVFDFGDAKLPRHAPKTASDGPAVQLVPTLDGRGYLVLAADGRVHAFGDARSYGSAPASAGPFTAIAITGDGRGYWLLARSGAIFSFGDAKGAITGLPAHIPGGLTAGAGT